MATNHYFSQKVKSEQNLYEDIIIESLKIYGQDVYYLPRELVAEDKILGEDIPSRFRNAYKVEMYIENTEGFDGEGDLFTKFGVEIRDQATFVLARRRWAQTVGRSDNTINTVRPREGDVIYLPLSNSMFQIMAVEHEQPFYQLSNLPTYKLRCELFEYSEEDFDTGVEIIDDVENRNSYTYVVTVDSASLGFYTGETLTQTLADGTEITGELVSFNPDTLVMEVIHVGADDGNYHSFVSGRSIVSDRPNVTTDPITLVETTEYAEAIVVSVTEENNLSQNEKNEYFETTSSDLGFLDFSESNPFGDPQ
jgi:hypothetical protein